MGVALDQQGTNDVKLSTKKEGTLSTQGITMQFHKRVFVLHTAPLSSPQHHPKATRLVYTFVRFIQTSTRYR